MGQYVVSVLLAAVVILLITVMDIMLFNTECPKNQYYNKETEICDDIKGIGAKCYDPKGCLANAECIGKKCTCPPKTYLDGTGPEGICRNQKSYNFSCDRNEECRGPVLVCNNGFCDCLSKYQYYNRASNSCDEKKTYNYRCSSNKECLGPNLVCSLEGLCKCKKDGSMYYNPRSRSCQITPEHMKKFGGNVVQCVNKSKWVSIFDAYFKDPCDDGVDGLLKPPCGKDMHSCDNGAKCVPLSVGVCDGSEDCKDGSDEDEELCSQPCREELFPCKDNKTCISNWQVCDKKSDHCPDGSDEDCTPPKCNGRAFACDDQSDCRAITNLCTGGEDCGDGSDEAGCGW